MEYSNWGREFIFLRKINGKWIFMRSVWYRTNLYACVYRDLKEIWYDYAVDELELIRKTGEK